MWRWKEFLFARAQYGAWLCLGDMVGLTGCVSPLKLNLGFPEGWVPVLFPPGNPIAADRESGVGTPVWCNDCCFSGSREEGQFH